MGIFGWIGIKARAVAAAISRGYKSFSGQATFEEADRMYEDIKKRFEEHKAFFEKEVENISSQIEEHVQSINKSKETIKTELFPAFAEKMHILKDIPVSESYLKEYFNGSNLKVDSIKTKANLYLIDFKKNPFKSNALAIISLGFYTRKKAKETLEKVREEKIRLEEEMVRMDSELIKLKNINDALEIIASYYTSMIDLYNALLSRLDNSVNFLIIKCLSYAHRIVHEQMSIKLLPKTQQAEIMAMVSISKIMKTMVDKNITLEGKTDVIQKSINSAKNDLRIQKEEINKLNEAA
ncbi:MAG: DNA repair protein [Bacilli bacterium]|nr:DNA repair protein [Bacilli bacterium]